MTDKTGKALLMLVGLILAIPTTLVGISALSRNGKGKEK